MGTIAGMRARFCGLVVALGVLPGLLAGCAGEPRAPVEQRGARASAPTVSVISTTVPDTPRHYVVVKGDTLYSIAFRFGVDFRQLAKANRIGAPFTIYPDQRLVLTGTAGTPVATRPPTARAAASDKAAATDKPAATGKPAATDKPAAAAKPTTAAAAVAQKPAAAGSIAWRWPTTGKVVKGFLGEAHKGIAISGKEGDPVVAAAPGEVVYAGSGIVGYGNLLIVKHNEVFLSAYGYNRRLLVGEGERVAAGQRIAEKGDSATDSVKLHFEIRRSGRPLDPLLLLPRR